MEKNKPEKKFIAGAVSATIWQNRGIRRNGEEAQFRTISIDRKYKDKGGNWQTTNTFRVNDLPRVSVVLNRAYEYLVLKNQEEDVNIVEIEDII